VSSLSPATLRVESELTSREFQQKPANSFAKRHRYDAVWKLNPLAFDNMRFMAATFAQNSQSKSAQLKLSVLP